ncbi:MAG: hypothetical protein N2044_12200 [Cyclobacteriaceae bacterium]|nr:hypothetical protein [Cyclobacteriaceae bacterium]
MFIRVIILFILGISCNVRSQESQTQSSQHDQLNVLRVLYEKFKNGQLSECVLRGKPVFTATLNAYDATIHIYDSAGTLLGTCNYAWGKKANLCRELKNCEVVYRVKENIWRQPAVDKFGLARKD